MRSLKTTMKANLSTIKQLLSTEEVSDEEVDKDLPSKGYLGEELKAQEDKMTPKIEACALKSESAESIEYSSIEIKEDEKET